MYRINVAAKSAGISTQLLRAWERRYGLLTPRRTDAGYRLYSDDDVAVLRGAKALVEEGRSISNVAQLPRAQLRAAAGRFSAIAAGIIAPMPASFLDEGIAAMAAFDGTKLDGLLLRATSMGALPSAETCDTVLMPLLAEIGERWEKGELSVAAEHFGTAIVRRHLHALVQNEIRRNADAPAIVCAVPEGELHEGGLLGFALHAAVLGWGIIYLGPNTPLRDVLATADGRGARGIAISLVLPRTWDEMRALAAELAAWQSRQPTRRVWLGGRGAQMNRGELELAGLDVLSDARRFEQRAPRD